MDDGERAEFQSALRTLGWTDLPGFEEAEWVNRIECDDAPAGPPVFEDSFVEEACATIGISSEVTAAIQQSLPRFRASRAWARIAKCCRRALFATPAERWISCLPAGNQPIVGLFFAVVALSGCQVIFERDRQRGIPRSVTQATYSDLELWMIDCHQRFGYWGLREINWLTAHLRGNLYQLGRLQFKFGVFADPVIALVHAISGEVRVVPETEGDPGFHPNHWQPILRRGDPVLEVHIPARGPLTRAACDDAFREAKDFFPRRFPERSFRAFTCHSWLLDPQLASYLRADANIVAFQRRFRLYQVSQGNHRQIFERVFGNEQFEPSKVPQETQLQRIVLQHVFSGGSWRLAAGLVPFILSSDDPLDKR